jgi:hypothetical protein
MDNLTSFEQIFREHIFSVPDYQRGYAWGERQWDDFVDDLESIQNEDGHYTGTIVLHPSRQKNGNVVDAEGGKYKLVDIVDGQQRLVTVVIFLNAIRREMNKFSDLHAQAAALEKTYVRIIETNGQPKFKIRLNADSHTFFSSNVLSDQPGVGAPTTYAETRLKEADEYFADLLGNIAKRERKNYPVWLAQVRNKICHQLQFTIFNVDSTSDVGVIFEVMNNRGKPLSDLDRIKNYLLFLASKIDVDTTAYIEDVNRVCSTIFRKLAEAELSGDEHENGLLRTVWLLGYEPQERLWEGYYSIRQKFRLRDFQGRHEELLSDLATYVKLLDDAVISYCDVLSPGRQTAFKGIASTTQVRTELSRAAEKLVRIGITAPFLPLLMSARLVRPDDSEAYLRLIKLCELFAFRVYRLYERRSNAGRADLFRFSNSLIAEAWSADDLEYRLRQLLLEFCSDEDVVEVFEEESEGWYFWPGLRYFLYEWEDHLAGKGPINLPWREAGKENSIEHVLPQQPNKAWRQDFSKSDREIFTHDFGNLVLTFHNSNYGNKNFDHKKGSLKATGPCYAKSQLASERALAEYDEWTMESIRDRREQMIEWALLRWAVDPVDEENEETEI